MPLIDQLIDQLNLNRQQVEGAAGLLLQQAQAQLSPEDFLRVADEIPAVSDFISKAPRQKGPEIGPLRALWQRWFSGWGSLASSQKEYEALGLSRSAVDQLITVISSYFREQGSCEVEKLLLGVWR